MIYIQWNRETIQSDMNDEFSVQIQIQSMSTTEVKLLSKFLRVMSILLQLTCFFIHTSEHQFFILIQLPLTVVKFYDITNIFQISTVISILFKSQLSF